jgi:hypothetical protein
MSIGIIIVNWRAPQYLEHQILSIRKYLSPDDIHVFETDYYKHCESICSDNYVYYNHFSTSNDYSKSHANALNYAYKKLSKNYDIIGIIDHDCFPTSHYNVIEMLGTCDIRAEEQKRGDILYPNTTCLFMKSNLDIDFMPSPGLDTGGRLSNIYKTECKMKRSEGPYGIEIFDDVFMHIGKGSNWINTLENQERVEKAFEYIKFL